MGKLWARSASSASWIRRACQGLGTVGAGFVVLVKVLEFHKVQMFMGLSGLSGFPKEPFDPRDFQCVKAVGAVGEPWTTCGSSGSAICCARCVLKVFGVGCVVPVAVWELQEMGMSCV